MSMEIQTPKTESNGSVEPGVNIESSMGTEEVKISTNEIEKLALEYDNIDQGNIEFFSEENEDAFNEFVTEINDRKKHNLAPNFSPNLKDINRRQIDEVKASAVELLKRDTIAKTIQEAGGEPTVNETNT